jgi:hypothetical protein
MSDPTSPAPAPAPAPTLEERQVVALERIARSLEHLGREIPFLRGAVDRMPHSVKVRY